MKDPNRFYTYAYLREDRTPYYIGKGKGRRVYKRGKGQIKPPKDKSRIIFLKQNLTEEEAFKHEKYMIAVFGRKDLGTGILHNKTDGGEGASGAVRSEETKIKISKSRKGKLVGKDNPFYGKSHSEENRRKISECNKGKTVSEETRRKISEGNKGKTVSEETRRKISISKSGENNPFYGKSLSEETKRKLSEANRGKNNPLYGKSHSEETKRKIGEAQKGKTLSQETRKKISEAISGVKNGSAKIWKITFDDGRTIKLNTVKKWAEENGYDISHISRVAQNKRNYHKDIVAVEILTE